MDYIFRWLALKFPDGYYLGNSLSPQVEVVDVPVRLRVEAEHLSARSTPVTFILTAQDDPRLKVEETARFLGPATSGR